MNGNHSRENQKRPLTRANLITQNHRRKNAVYSAAAALTGVAGGGAVGAAGGVEASDFVPFSDFVPESAALPFSGFASALGGIAVLDFPLLSLT